MLSELKPQSKHLVYNLVTEAGVDTSDWAYSKGSNPAANRHKNSEWAFWDDAKQIVAVCLWYSQMQERDGVIFQELNYREVARKADGVRVARSQRMDQGLYMAFKRKLPVRVIIVDGPRRGEAGAEFSEVERRMLDPAEWSVATYNADTGACRLERHHQPAKRTFLLTWGNFEETPDSEIADIAKKLERAETVEGQWSSGNRKDINVGERVFLLRQGSDAPGLIGWGTVSEKPFEDEHWDPVRREAGVKANYIMVSWREVVPKEAVVPRARLVELGVPGALLNAQGSGVIIPEDISGRLEVVWGGHYRSIKAAIPVPNSDSPESSSQHKLARIAYNSAGWQHPTGEAGDHESGDTYNAQNKFGHEDWLFRSEWVIEGWRYAFIQGLNNAYRIKYLGQSLDISLYTIEPDKKRRLVATIYGLESLNDQQAKDALAAFKVRGWLKAMQDEVKAIGGNAEALGDPKWAEHVLNVRYRLENVELHPPETFLPDDDWIHNRHRYMLYNFEPPERTRVEQSGRGRRGSQDAPEARQLFRRGTKPVEYTPEHDKMQALLMAELQSEYGREYVWREQDFVDVRVEKGTELIYFEIKTDLDPRAVIRQALGQILEYAYHPSRAGRRPNRLVIVGRTPLGEQDEAYLRGLCERFALPLGYRVLPI